MQETKNMIEEMTPIILKKLPSALRAKIFVMAETNIVATGSEALDWLSEEEQKTIEETVESVLGDAPVITKHLELKGW